MGGPDPENQGVMDAMLNIEKDHYCRFAKKHMPVRDHEKNCCT